MQDMTSNAAGSPDKKPDGHTEIDDTRMPLMEHLTELRQRLIYSVLGIGLAFVLCFAFARQIYTLLVNPYKWAAYWATGSHDKIKLIFTHPAEFFFTQLKLALFGAVCLSFPNLAIQVYKFVAPGLYKNEKAAFVPYLIATPVLFIVGILVVYFIVAPAMMYFFLKMQFSDADISIELLPRVADYLSLIMTLVLGFGVCFQLPVVLTLMARAGIVTGASLREFRRYAVVAIAAVAGVLSPPDPFSMLAMMAPTILLYEGSILMVDRIVKQNEEKAAKAAAAD